MRVLVLRNRSHFVGMSAWRGLVAGNVESVLAESDGSTVGGLIFTFCATGLPWPFLRLVPNELDTAVAEVAFSSRASSEIASQQLSAKSLASDKCQNLTF